MYNTICIIHFKIKFNPGIIRTKYDAKYGTKQTKNLNGG